jgi:murein DD-endopeptidase MepM/ murein hydrolase activator NlpD
MRRLASWRLLFAAVLAVFIAVTTRCQTFGAEPLQFKLPLACGASYVGSTYPGHTPHAVDFNQPGQRDLGDPVLASAAGTVGQVVIGNGQVTLEHGGGWQTVYAHMYGIVVRRGQQVEVGQVIGRIGSAGYSTGPHLHYQQDYLGRPVPVRFDGVGYRFGATIKSTNCPVPVATPTPVPTLEPSATLGTLATPLPPKTDTGPRPQTRIPARADRLAAVGAVRHQVPRSA